MALNFSKLRFNTVPLPTGSKTLPLTKGRVGAVIPTSDTLTGIELRLSRVHIIDNKTPEIWPFIRYSDLYLMLVSVDNLGKEPYLVTIKGFENVDDGEDLPVERTAYYWKGKGENPVPPEQVHLLVSVIKSNAGVRDLGAALEKLRGKDDFKAVVAKVMLAASTGGGSAIADAAMALAGVLGGILGKVDDTPLITQVLSYTDINGDFDQLGRHVFTAKNRYVELETKLIVRDATREPKG